MRPTRSQGFTLVELLVVISIIGLLASVVLVALQGARTKGTTASAIEFDDNVYHTTGDQLAGDWEFNDGSGSTAKDSSIYGNNGAFEGTSPTWSTNTPTGSGYSLSFGGAGDVIIPASASLNFGGTGMTLSMWVNVPSLSGNDALIGQRNGCGAVNWQFYANISSRIYFAVVTSGNPGGATVQSTIPLGIGQWHLLTVTYDGSTLRMYYDGNLNSTLTGVSGTLANGSSGPTYYSTYIGDEGCPSNRFIGSIDEVRLYKEALTADAVQNVYAEGAGKYYAMK